jgi:hypothetical protein
VGLQGGQNYHPETELFRVRGDVNICNKGDYAEVLTYHTRPIQASNSRLKMNDNPHLPIYARSVRHIIIGTSIYKYARGTPGCSKEYYDPNGLSWK